MNNGGFKLGDKAPKDSKKSPAAKAAKKEKKKADRQARQSVVAGFSSGAKRVLNHKKAHGRHSKNGDK